MQLEEVLGEMAVRSPRGKIHNKVPGPPAAKIGANAMNAEAAEKPEAAHHSPAPSPCPAMLAQVTVLLHPYIQSWCDAALLLVFKVCIALGLECRTVVASPY